MNSKACKIALLVAAIGALGATGAAAKVLKHGNYEVAGMQQICLVKDGTWYGETFTGWSGHWFVGPTKEDGTVLVGNYNSGAGNDAMTVSGGNVDWIEFADDGLYYQIIDSTFTNLNTACTPPAARANTHKNPMD